MQNVATADELASRAAGSSAELSRSRSALEQQAAVLTAARMVNLLAGPATGCSTQLVELGLMLTEALTQAGRAARKEAQAGKGGARPWICSDEGTRRRTNLVGIKHRVTEHPAH